MQSYRIPAFLATFVIFGAFPQANGQNRPALLLTGKAATVRVELSGGSISEFRLADARNGTRLTVVESGFASLPDDIRENSLRNNTQGWDEQMGNIQKYLETA